MKIPLCTALAGALLRCPSLVWLATRRSGRLALHPASAAQNSIFFPENRLRCKPTECCSPGDRANPLAPYCEPCSLIPQARLVRMLRVQRRRGRVALAEFEYRDRLHQLFGIDARCGLQIGRAA